MRICLKVRARARERRFTSSTGAEHVSLLSPSFVFLLEGEIDPCCMDGLLGGLCGILYVCMYVYSALTFRWGYGNGNDMI